MEGGRREKHEDIVRGKESKQGRKERTEGGVSEMLQRDGIYIVCEGIVE